MCARRVYSRARSAPEVVHCQGPTLHQAVGMAVACSGEQAANAALRREPARPGAAPLLQCVMRAGQVIPPAPDLAVARQRQATDRAHLAESYRRLEGGAVYPVRIREVLATLQQQVETALRQQCQVVPAASA